MDIVMQTVFVQTVFVQTVFVIKVQVNLIWPDFIRWEHIRALNQNDGLFQEVRKAKHFQTLTHKEALFLLHLQYWSLSVFAIGVASAQSYFLNNQTQTTSLFINSNSFLPLRKLFPKVNVISGQSLQTPAYITIIVIWLSVHGGHFSQLVNKHLIDTYRHSDAYTNWAVRNNKASSDHKMESRRHDALSGSR